MTIYDNDYFFIDKEKDNDHLPSLVPDIDTRDRKFRYERQPLGSAPLIFYNGWKDENRASKIKDLAADILFDGSDFMVRSRLREKLLTYDFPHLHLHPSVYIDDRDAWQEDYWYLTFTDSFDCWDRSASRYEADPLVIGKSVRYAMYSYSLNSKLLDETPLEKRLLFRMGGTTDGMIVCHKSIAGIFRGGASGATLTPVADW